MSSMIIDKTNEKISFLILASEAVQVTSSEIIKSKNHGSLSLSHTLFI